MLELKTDQLVIEIETSPLMDMIRLSDWAGTTLDITEMNGGGNDREDLIEFAKERYGDIEILFSEER